MVNQYDYIICGAGAAGLSLAFRLCDPDFHHLNILLIDKDEKKENDHTWCFWDKMDSPFDAITSNQFSKINFYSQSLEKSINIAPYRYKMIQSDTFYSMVREKIEQSPHISWIKEEVLEITDSDQDCTVTTNHDSYTCKEVFTSIFKGQINQEEHLYVAQVKQKPW